MNFWTGLHLFSFIVYTVAVCYVIIKNPHAVINWVLSVFFFLFALWSACSVILDNTGVSLAAAGIVMKIQGIAWASFISYYFIFILYLTNNKRFISGQLLILLILVVPGIFIYQNINGHMLECCNQVYYGMAGKWSATIWPKIYFIYYIIMFIGGTYLLFRYRNVTRIKAEKKVIDILIVSAIVVFALGTFLSVILNSLGIFIPIDTNVIFLIFVLGFIYSAEKYETFNISSVRNADRIMDLITDGIVLIDKDGTLNSVNRPAMEIFGYSGVIIPDSGYEFVEALVKKAGVDPAGAEVHNSEIAFADAQGADKTVLISSRALLQGQGNSGRVCTVRDITTKKKAELALVEKMEELKLSNEDLESFAHVASHDLKEPLGVVIYYLQLIRKKFIDKLDKDGTEFLNLVSEGAIKMSVLIEALLDYSRLTKSGREYSQVNTSQAVSRALAALNFSILDKKASVETAGQLPAIKADRIQIEQLFKNLIDNALKFSGKTRPVITISAAARGDFFEFTIKDNGIGIDKADFEKVFRIFKRLHKSYEYEGTGVGLAVSKKIVEYHGGKIRVESEGPGKGSSFIFTIRA